MPIDTPPVIWATETTYPSGPTAGDICKVQPVGDLELPGVKTPAEYRNYNFNAWTNAIRTSYALAVSSAISNWSASINVSAVSGVTGANNWSGFGYDYFYSRWIGCMYSVNSGNFINLCVSYNGGRTWASAFTSSSATGVSTPIAMAVGNFGNNTTLVIALGAVHATAHAIQGASDTLTTLGGPADTATAWSTNSAPATGNFYTYYTLQTAGTFVGHLQGAATDGITWNPSITIPAAFASGTNHVGNLLSCPGPLVGAASVSVVAICGVTAGTDTAHLMTVNYAGTVCTDITPAFLTGMVISGLAYGAQDGLWGILCNNGAGGESYLYTSPDLVTWTQVWTTATGAGALGLQVIGTVWALTFYNGTSTQLLLSKDVGLLGASSTWHQASSFNQNVTMDGQGGLFSNGNQLVAANDTQVSVSLQAGFI